MRVVAYTAAVALAIGLTGPVAAAAQAPGGDARTIEMVGTDDLKFSVTTIQAKPGERLRVVLKTESRMPKIAMAHNFALLAKDIDVERFINASAMARTTEYIAPAMKDQVLAATGMAGAGETTEVTFTAPTEPGEYLYVCTFPGHYTGGMIGKLIVK